MDALTNKEADKLLEECGLDLRPFRKPELAENLSQVISAISFLKMGFVITLALLLITALFSNALLPADLHPLLRVGAHLYFFLAAAAAGLLTALAFVAHRIVGSIGDVMEVFFGVLRVVVGGLLKAPPPGKKRPTLVALVRGVALVIFLPALAEVLKDKLGLLGRIFFGAMQKVFLGPVLAVAAKVSQRSSAVEPATERAPILDAPAQLPNANLGGGDKNRFGILVDQVDAFCAGVLSLQGKLGPTFLLPFRLMALFAWTALLIPMAWLL